MGNLEKNQLQDDANAQLELSQYINELNNIHSRLSKIEVNLRTSLERYRGIDQEEKSNTGEESSGLHRNEFQSLIARFEVFADKLNQTTEEINKII